MPGPFVATLDIGSSSIKGAVVDLERYEFVATAKSPFPDPIPGLPRRHFEVSPAAIVASVQFVLEQLFRARPRCDRLLVCSQMGGVILADPSGAAVSNYLSWRDERVMLPCGGDEETAFARLLKSLSPVQKRELGYELKPGTALSILSSLADDDQLRGAIPLGLGDFVIGQLTGTRPTSEPTAAMGLLDVARQSWHHDVFQTLGLDRFVWPELNSYRSTVGFWKHGDGKAWVHPAVGDHQAALLGTMLDEGELSINISTGSQVSQLTNQFQPGNYQTRPYFDSLFLNTITHIPAGRSLSVLVHLLSELAVAQGVQLSDPWSYIADEAAKAADGDMRVDLAFFESAIGNRGSIDRITTENLTVGHLFRAAFRGMADRYAELAQRLSSDQTWRQMVLSGGLAKVAVLRQFIGQRLPFPTRLVDIADETLVGLSILGSVVSGQTTSVAEAIDRRRKMNPDGGDSASNV